MVGENYDIIIVGAGPAGCMAALHSTGNVLLVEKKGEIGVPVYCGEGLSGKIIDFFDLHNCTKGFHTLRNIEINFPNGKNKKMKMNTLDIYIIDKEKFLQRILKKAKGKKNLNLTIRTNTKANYINNKIFLDDDNIVDGHVIIAADGKGSSIGRSVGLTKPLRQEDIHLCVQYTVYGNFDPNTVKLYFDKPYAPKGYVWVFPKGEKKANVGLGIPATYNDSLNRLIDWFIAEKYPNSIKQNFFVSPIGLAPPIERYVSGKVLLVGDAARLTISPTGAGIGNALLSGKVAGEVASNYLNGKCKLEAYQVIMRYNLYRKLCKGYRLKQKILNKDMNKKIYRMASIMFSLHSVFPKSIERYAFQNFRF